MENCCVERMYKNGNGVRILFEDKKYRCILRINLFAPQRGKIPGMVEWARRKMIDLVKTHIPAQVPDEGKMADTKEKPEEKPYVENGTEQWYYEVVEMSPDIIRSLGTPPESGVNLEFREAEKDLMNGITEYARKFNRKIAV